jgi:hypothetical protein
MFSFRSVVIVGVLLVVIAAFFSFQSVKRSQAKNFWFDETSALSTSVRPVSLKTLLISGAPHQFSSQPLDFIFVKIFDQARDSRLAAKIPHNVYYRLNALFWTLFSGLLISFLFLFHLSGKSEDRWIFWAQSLCLFAGMVSYYFWPSNIYYSTEMRAYALWNALWFMLAALIMLDNRPRWSVLVVAVLLSMTASAAVLELFFLGLSRFIFMMHDRQKFWVAVQDGLNIFLIPALIAIYYSSKNSFPDFPQHSPDVYRDYMMSFIAFWGEQWKVPFFSGLGILLTASAPRWRGCSAVFLTMLFLYISAPVLNFVILAKGVFFSGRYYQYYHLIVPFFFLALALVLPDYWNRLKGKKL